MCAALTVLPSGSRATTAVSVEPSATFYANGTILAIAAAPDQVYVGGDFSLLGRPTGSWVGIGSDGAPVAGRPPVEGSVAGAVSDGRGGWFLAGTLGVSSESPTSVIHVRANGQLDRGWRAAVRGGKVRTVARKGRMLFLGGTFKTVGGKRRRGLAAVDTTRGHVLPWRLHGDPLFVSRGGKRSDPGTVDTLALSRDARTLFLSGSFNRIGGKERAWVGAIRVETGRATGWNPAPNGLVGIVEPAQRGRAVYIAGDFTHVGGARRNELAAVDDRTGKSLAFNAHVSNYASITDLVATPTTVYVAGDFTSLGGRSRHLLASLDARTGAVTAWEPSVTGDEVDALAVDAGRNTVYLAGRLSEVGGERRDALAAVDARTGAVTPWDPRALGDPKVLLRGAGGIVFAGGRIAFVGGVRRHGLASITAAGSVTDWDPPLDGTVRSLALSPDNSRLYVGGAFAPGDAPAQRNLAVVDRSTGTLHAFGGGTNSGVWAIAPSADGSVLYIGGAFVTVAGKRRVRLAALDASTGTLLAWNSGANDLVRVLLPAGDALYAGGDFASAGGLPRARLVKLDASTGSALGWNPEADDNVWALALRDQTLFVGGEFGHIGGKSRNRLAALDVESGAASSWDPNADDIVRVLGLSGDSGRLFAGGAFEKIGASRRGYAEFSLPDGSLTGWNPVEAFDSYALASVPASSSLVIGGEGGADVFR